MHKNSLTGQPKASQDSSVKLQQPEAEQIQQIVVKDHEENEEDKGCNDDFILDLVSFEYIYTSLKAIDSTIIAKCKQIIHILKQEPIDLKKLLTFSLADDSPGLRAIAWRMLINYLPTTRKRWINIIETNEKNYNELVEENIISKQKKMKPQNDINKGTNQLQFKPCKDHPLSKHEDSPWQTYFSDIQLWNKIEKDSKRTRMKEQFFAQQLKRPKYNSGPAVLSKNRQEDVEYSYDALTRILFIYAKLNPAGYVQGMNEIAAVIYYCFTNDTSRFLNSKAESDSFYCFNIIMTELKQNFFQVCSIEDQTKEFDNDKMKEKIKVFSDLFKKVDHKLWQHFEINKIDPKLYCVRWFMVSLTQEFRMEEALKIWDALLMVKDKNAFLNYLCVAILYTLREELFGGDFSFIITKLQNISDIDINKVMQTAFNLYLQYQGDSDYLKYQWIKQD